jgi:hypothetical protein
MRYLLPLIFLVLLSLSMPAQEGYQVLVVSPGYQKDYGLKKDLESVATQFDHVVEAQDLDQVLRVLQQLGTQHKIARLVFLGHGYLGQQDTGGLIDLGEDVNAAVYETQRRRFHRKGESRLIDAFERDAEIIYFNCHAGKDPNFLKETANLFLTFSGGTVYGSDDYVVSEVSAGNRIRYILSYLPFVGDEEVSFESPSKVNYTKFTSHTVEAFLWRSVQPAAIGIAGQAEVKVHSRLQLDGKVPAEWTDGACSDFIKYRWTENGKVIGTSKVQSLEFPKVGERTFTLEVFLDNEIGARKLGQAIHKVKVVERKLTTTQDPPNVAPPVKTPIEFQLVGPSQVVYSDLVTLGVEVPPDLAGKADTIVWRFGSHSNSQPLVISYGLPGVEGPLACPGGDTEPPAEGDRILVQPMQNNCNYFAELQDKNGKIVARSRVFPLEVLPGKFQVTLHGDWVRQAGASFYVKRRPTLDAREKTAKASLLVLAGEAHVGIDWLTSDRGPRRSEIQQTVRTAGGFVGNGRYFVKGLAAYEVDCGLDSYPVKNGDTIESGKLLQKWKPLFEQHQVQARKDMESVIKSLRVGGSELLVQGPVTKLPTSPTAATPGTATPPTPSSSSPEANAATSALEEAAEQAKTGDYEAAAATLASHRNDPEAAKRYKEALDWAARSREIERLAAQVQQLVEQRKLPSAVKLIQQIGELRNRQPSLRGGKSPACERAESLYHAKKKEYDDDWLDFSYRRKEFFTQKDWQSMRQLCEHMMTWELFSENEVKGNLQQAISGLAAQQQAWGEYEAAKQDFAAGLLDQVQPRQQALRQLEAALQQFGQQDPRWSSLSALLIAIRQGRAPLTVRVDPASDQIAAGGEMLTTAHADGGTPPYRFEWFVFNERTGTVNQAKIWQWNQAGRYLVRVVATDSAGRTAEGTCDLLVVSGSPASTTTLAARIEPFSARVVLGTTLRTIVHVRGGVPPYSYRWYHKGKAYGDTDSMVWRLNNPGPLTVEVLVTDAAGAKVQAQSNLTGVAQGAVKPTQPNTPTTPTTGASRTSTITFVNESSQPTHIFVQEFGFSPDNRLPPGGLTRSGLTVKEGKVTTFCAGRDGRVLTQVQWSGSPRNPTVVYTTEGRLIVR